MTTLWRGVRSLVWASTSAAFAFILLAGVYCLSIVSAGPLLTIRDVPAPSDVIVVLGGDGPARAARAAALWHEGVASRVLITGRGDCLSIRGWMIEAGVDPAVFTVECQSASTWENAEFSQPILTQMGVRSAVLVTSWFHSRRALDRFRTLMPDIAWISVPAEQTRSYWTLFSDPLSVQIVKEYPKTLFYDLRTHILSLSTWSGFAKPGESGAGFRPAKPSGYLVRA